MDAIALHLCHNNPRNGIPRGVLMSLSIGGDRLTLDSPWIDRGLKCEVGPTRLFLGKRKEWPHVGYRTWVGNWCWDTVYFAPNVAAEVIGFALARGYTPSVGDCALWDKIDRGEPLTAADLLSAVW